MSTSIDKIRYELAKRVVHSPKRGNGTVELIGSSFTIDMEENPKATLFGKRNEKYIEAEIEWYNSTNRSVNALAEIYGKRVKIWDDIAGADGRVNSNYGWCIFSGERGSQYFHALNALRNNTLSRQAVMLYQDPFMHTIAGKDFTCTNAVQYYLRPHEDFDDHYRLDAVVQMRSNDAVFGFNNDYAWQHRVVESMCRDFYWGRGATGHQEVEPMNVVPGIMTWQASSLHLYERHYDFARQYWYVHVLNGCE